MASLIPGIKNITIQMFRLPLTDRTKALVIFNSTDDHYGVLKAVKILRSAISDITYREFDGYGHFCLDYNMPSQEFPELLEAIVS